MSGQQPVVELVEVGPRDGLQDVDVIVPTHVKVELIRRLVAAGLRRIEVSSFAHPERVPQMADAELVFEQTADLDADLIGLVLNERGLQRALRCGVRSINTVVLTTDEFSRRNQGLTTDEAVAMARRVVTGAHADAIRVGVTLSAAMGCPYEGAVPLTRVLDIADSIVEAGVDELSLADTIGVGTPDQVEDLVSAVRDRFDIPVRAHLHDRGGGEGLANVAAAIRGGARYIDASIGGLGGCPFAPKSGGNVATAAVARLLAVHGLDPALDFDELDAATELVAFGAARPPEPT
jgi:hydroxymethylglutaryl-CoA lyase